ncbi:hypothetical protein Ae168Ps1_6338c [Pseudonocardia sp. Ae168_Ps1]|nr:hypothetical protein Ae168Ps1_6338c [Pseudonocardia sp. Ae168_Ps1]OLL70372.1 hypothetical protein Ae263Ps1_6316c [Pseudonocardia sp. Ae263_Ps1]OLL89153.1 hypothetical protein Ae356Ps1_6181c [Pseudonocardia sp. Ae356_Ps1]
MVPVTHAANNADRSSLVRVADALAERGLVDSSRGDQLYARCPAHDDGSASLSVTWRTDSRTGAGRTFVRCHTGCDARAVVEALGLNPNLSDLYDEPPARPTDSNRARWEPEHRTRTPRTTSKPRAARGKARRRLVETYGYCDEYGRLIYEVSRWVPKEFTVRVVDSAGRRQPRWPVKSRRVLYRLPSVLAAITAGTPVWLVEGEKDADALTEAGVTATCNAGGAAANGAEHDRWLPQYTESLRGAHVVIVMDRDEDDPEQPGRQHAAHLADQLAPVAASVSVVRAAEGKDAADHLAAGRGLEDFERVELDAAEPVTPQPEQDPAPVDVNGAAAPTTATEAPAAPNDPAAATVDLTRERQRRRGTDDGTPPPRRSIPKIRDEYEVLDDELCKIETKGRGEDRQTVARVLLPAAPKLLRRLRYDLGDGAPPRVTHYDLAVSRDGETIDLPAIAEEDWQKLTWVADLPWPCPIDDTQSGRSKVRAGIVAVSGPTPVETLYGSLGWREIGGGWVYLHAGGAIDARGARPDIRIETSPKYRDFALPAPFPAGDSAALSEALTASFGLMDAIPDRLAVPMLGAAYRACLGYSRVTILPVGGPSSGKTGLAAVGQQHYCPAARYDHLPFGAGEDAATLTSLEEHRFTVGDMLTIVDDGAPDRGTEALGRRLNVLARSQAEQRGKDRGARTGGIRPEHKPRGLLGVTAEQWVGIESAETRVVALDMRRGELNPRDAFGPLDAGNGPELRARLTATLVQHYADRMPMTSWLRSTRTVFTDAMVRSDSPDPGVEARRSEAVADLGVGWRALLDMAVTRGALTEEQAAERWSRVWVALIETRDRMMAGSVERRPTEIAASSLRSALVRQTAALRDPRTGEHPVNAELCGWERLGGSMETTWRRVGSPIGWTDGDRVWLDPAATTEEISRQSRAAGIPLNLTRDGLGGALADAGILRTRETAKGRRTTRKIRVGLPGGGPNPQVTVWDAPWSWLWPTDDDDDDDTGDDWTLPLGDDQGPDGEAPDPEQTAPAPEHTPAPPSAAPTQLDALADTAALSASEVSAEPADRETPPNDPAPEPAARESGAEGQEGTRPGCAGLALVAAAAIGWLARPDGDPVPVDLADDAAALGALLNHGESLGLGHRDGRGQYRGAKWAYGQIWILPGAREKLGLPAELPEDHTHVLRKIRDELDAAGWGMRENATLSGWNVIFRKDGRRFHLVIPEWQIEPSPFGELTEPAQVLARRLGAYARTTGVAYRYSPGVTGVSLIGTTRPELVKTARPELPKPTTLPTLEGDYIWQRPMQPDESAMPYVDAWDVNGLFLGAATSLPLGLGAPEEITDAPQFDPNVPGYWRINTLSWDDARLPDPLQVAGRRRGGDYLWVTTPTMKILTDLYELAPEISKAYVWPHGAPKKGDTWDGRAVRVLDKWVRELKNARNDLLGETTDDERAILAAVKATYRAGIGRLDAASWRGSDYPLHRPDWRHHIVAQGRYALTRKIVTAAKSADRYPLAIATDAVLYASDDPTPAAPAGWVEGDQLGQVKHIGRLPSTDVAALLADGGTPKSSTYDGSTIVDAGLMDRFKHAGGER